MPRVGHAIVYAALMSFSFLTPAAEVQDALAAAQKGDYNTAYGIWVELAEKGNDKAAVEAGLMHHLGHGRPVSYSDAMTWYLKAFPKNGDAWNNIGVLHRDGLGVPKNRKIAYVMFLAVHMAGMGTQATVMRANRNLRREISELTQIEKNESLCYTTKYIDAYVLSRGELAGIPESLRASPQQKRIRELNWWLPGEITHFDCPDGT